MSIHYFADAILAVWSVAMITVWIYSYNLQDDNGMGLRRWR